MGFFSTVRAIANLSEGLPTDPIAVADTTAAAAPWYSRAEQVAVDIALTIPAVRRAVAVIAGTTSTFEFIAWDPRTGTAIPPHHQKVRILKQPDRTELLHWSLARTMQDIIWRDLSIWRATDWYLDGTIARADRVHPNRVDRLRDPLDDDRTVTWLIDGNEVPRSNLVVIDGAGIGGLRRYGYELLTLYGQLQAAAGRYAVAPHPHAILKNSGADLTDEEINALLDSWEAARATRSVGYMNDAMDYETHGWNAEELQLTEAREHAALEVARLFGLPAKAVDAKSGDSMTYANTVDARRDIAQSLRPWQKPLIASLSAVTGVRVEFDTDDFTRDDPKTRMDTWALGIDRNILTLDEVRALEPLAARRHP